jgi:rhamnulokinase
MSSRWTALAADLGASSGKVIAAGFDGKTLTVEDVHRFDNDPVETLGTLHWDILRLFHEIKTGVRKGCLAHKDVKSIGIDTWAIDFGLLDKNGRLMGNPVHYRDHRNDGVMDKVCSALTRKTIFEHSGIQFLPFNTIFQLAGMQQRGEEILDQAQSFLLIPDLLGYFFTGQKGCEFTNATTTQLVEPGGEWSSFLIDKLKLPKRIFPKIVQPGTSADLLPSIVQELGGAAPKFITVATHDTGSAVAATPATSEPFAYVSCGTWSLLGTETRTPVTSEKALALNFTNEGGFGGTYRVLKNIMGLWLLQELKREWERAGKKLSWGEITAMTSKAPAFGAIINPDDPRFMAPGDMSTRVRDFCRETGQKVPEGDGALARCITESLALKYRWVLERLEELVGAKMPQLHMVGGGIQNELLCQWAADACGRPVIAGPVEATALGNIAVQMIAAKEVSSLKEAREIIGRSLGVKRYEPAKGGGWEDAYGRLCKLL